MGSTKGGGAGIRGEEREKGEKKKGRGGKEKGDNGGKVRKEERGKRKKGGGEGKKDGEGREGKKSGGGRGKGKAPGWANDEKKGRGKGRKGGEGGGGEGKKKKGEKKEKKKGGKKRRGEGRGGEWTRSRLGGTVGKSEGGYYFLQLENSRVASDGRHGKCPPSQGGLGRRMWKNLASKPGGEIEAARGRITGGGCVAECGRQSGVPWLGVAWDGARWGGVGGPRGGACDLSCAQCGSWSGAARRRISRGREGGAADTLTGSSLRRPDARKRQVQIRAPAISGGSPR